MKKLIVVAAVLSLVSVNMFADYKSEEHFTITKGDVSWIKENAYARVSVDLSNAQIVHFNDKGEVKESLGLYKDYYEGGEENMHKDEIGVADFCAMPYNGLCKALNVYTKKAGVKIVISEETEKMAIASGTREVRVFGAKCLLPDVPIKYVVVVKVETMDVGNYNPMAGPMLKRAGSAWISGKMSVIDMASGVSVFEATLDKVRGYGGAAAFIPRLGNLISCELLVNDIYKPAYNKK